MTPRLRWSALALVAGLLGSGCSYRNAMWSAGRHAKDARQLEQRGQLSEARTQWARSEEHTSELQSRLHLVCRLLLEKKKENEKSATHSAHTVLVSNHWSWRV